MRRSIPYIIATTLLALTLTGMAQEGKSLKERMIERRGAVAALLADGKVGEGNDGFLVVRAKVAESEQQVIDGENNDRKTIYQAIASKRSLEAKAVGERRAKQIAERADTGIWIQDSAGKWQKKR